MEHLPDMLWIELRKAVRSRMILWTALAASFMPLGIAFLIFVSKNADISQRLGLVGAKANLIAYAGIDWAGYLAAFGQMIGAGGFILSVFAITWIFGREFTEGTVKDLLSVPVPRSGILLAKFLLAAAWSALLSVVIFAGCLVTGAFLRLPGTLPSALAQGGAATLAVTTLLVIPLVMPFAYFASLGRGFLLSFAAAALVLMLVNLTSVLGRAEFFPWAIPLVFAQGKIPLGAASYAIVVLTGLAGMAVTDWWWKHADQNR